jgi:hypothetical protein
MKSVNYRLHCMQLFKVRILFAPFTFIDLVLKCYMSGIIGLIILWYLANMNFLLRTERKHEDTL